MHGCWSRADKDQKELGTQMAIVAGGKGDYFTIAQDLCFVMERPR